MNDEEHDADDADRHVLAAQIGLRALGDRAGDLLHALRAGVALHDVVDGPHAVGDREGPPKMMRMSAIIVPSLLSSMRGLEEGKRARSRPRQAGPEECAPSLPNFAPNRKRDVAGAKRDGTPGRANPLRGRFRDGDRVRND